MSSNPSSSIASSNKRSRFDPSVVLLPIFIGFLRAAPLVLFFDMFLGPEFGLVGDQHAPTGWALVPISAIGFWSVRLLPKRIRDPRVLNGALLFLGMLCWAAWMALEPGWHFGDIVRDPLSIVGENSHFAWVFIITIFFWILGLRLALDEREQSAEGVRGIMIRSLVALLAMVILASVIGDDIGAAGLDAGYIALPVALVSGIGAVGLSEMISTRNTARRRGATVPGWDRWSRTFLGSAAIILAITFVSALVFGPGFLSLVVDSLATAWRGISQILLWIMYGFAYAIFWIVRGVIWVLNHFFDTSIEPVGMPELQEVMEDQGGEPAVPEESEPWRYASLLRLGGIVALVIAAFLILTRFVRYRLSSADMGANEERTSVFSGSLLRNQLRNLFRRREHGERPHKLNLARPPDTVRETMLYLQVLTQRLGIGRSIRETPHDFTSRLGKQWPQLQQPLTEIRDRYERVRYGESEEDRASVVAAWSEIWTSQKDVPGATG